MYGAQDPGNWQSFTQRQDVKSLPLMEQKSKFIREQTDYQNLMESVRAQVNVAGIRNNPIVSVVFAGDIDTVTGFTSQLLVTYTSPVTIVGSSPVITVSNGQQGGGSAASISYDYNAGSSTLTTLRFDYVQTASATNTGAIAANVLFTPQDLVATAGVVIGQPSLSIAGTYNIATTDYTTSGAGTGAAFQIIVADGTDLDTAVDNLLPSFTTNPTNCAAKTTTGVTFTTIGSGINGVATVVTTGTTAPTITGITITTPGSGYVVGEQLTIATGALGTGQLITTDDLLSQTTTAGIGNVTGPFTMAISSTSAVGAGGTITLTGDGANALTAVSVSSIGTGYVNGEVLTISNADLVTAGFAGATGDVAITLQASDVQDSDEAAITLTADNLADAMNTINVAVEGTLFIPTEVISLNAGVLGAGSTGGTITLASASLKGDTLLLSGKNSIEGGVVSNVSDQRPVQGTLTKSATKTATAE